MPDQGAFDDGSIRLDKSNRVVVRNEMQWIRRTP